MSVSQIMCDSTSINDSQGDLHSDKRGTANAYWDEIASKLPQEAHNTSREVTTDNTSSAKDQIACPECGLITKGFKTKQHMQLNSEITVFACDECSLAFKSNDSLRKHQFQHSDERPSSCLHCDKMFKSKRELDHIERYDKEDGVLKNSSACNECGCIFKLSQALHTHYEKHTSDECYFCYECGKGFKRKSDLVDHLQCHELVVLESCPECGEKFSGKAALTNHMSIFHSAKSYSCKECGASFTDMSGLRLHLPCHYHDSIFKCKFCEDKFSFKQELNWHYKDHKKMPGTVTCCKCGGVFSSFLEVFNHSRALHQVTLYACCKCRKTFETYNARRKHSNSMHPRKGSVNCERCGKNFWNDTNLMVHQKTQCFE